jgi:hypothetical protein
MHVRAAQKDGFAVKKYAGTVDADIAEADVIGELILAGSTL